MKIERKDKDTTINIDDIYAFTIDNTVYIISEANEYLVIWEEYVDFPTVYSINKQKDKDSIVDILIKNGIFDGNDEELSDIKYYKRGEFELIFREI